MFRRSAAALRITEYSFGHPPLNARFGGVKFTQPTTGKDNGIQTTVLPNGLKVITHDKSQPVASVGFYCEVGAKYDPTSKAPGLNAAMRDAIFGGNMENSLFQNDRAFRGRGASYSSTEIRKRFLGWKSEVRRDMVQPIVNTIGLGIVAPRFAESDIERFRDTWDNNLEEMKFKQMHEYAAMQLESVAFFKEPLGNPRMVQKEFNGACSSSNLIEHWAQHVVPNRMVLAGVNVEHEQLVSAYLSIAYPHSKDAPHHARSTVPELSSKDEKAQFRAGAERHDVEDLAAETWSPDQKEDACVAIGWLASGRDGNLKDFAAASVLHELVGASLADSLNVDTRGYLDGVRSFYNPFSTAGLMGLTVKSDSANIVDAVRSAAKLPTSVDESAIEGAKQRAIARMFANELDVQRDYVDHLATSNVGFNDVSIAVKSVTAADLKKELDSLKAQAPALYAVGHVVDLPNLRTIIASQK